MSKAQFTAVDLHGKRLHFVGIGGISMSSLAMIAKKRGAAVTGSDSTRSRITAALESAGITVYYGHAAENVAPDTTAVVHTAAVHADNPELHRAAELGITCLTRAEFFGRLMRPYPVRIGIAGTHGKSTTTSMAALISLDSQLDPTIVCGAELDEIGGTFRIGEGGTIIFEACEYTDSFLSFCPTCAIVLNVELEHVDYFKGLAQITESFHRFISLADTAVVCADSAQAMRAAEGYRGRLITYSALSPTPGAGADIHYYAAEIAHEGSSSSFSLRRRDGLNDEKLCDVRLRIPGMHNISDAVAAAAACLECGASPAAVESGLDRFHGAKRRFEMRGKTAGGAEVYDDYAHHPTEIKATLDAARTLGKRVWCVFQPHTYTRTFGLFRELSESFGNADRVIVTDIYSAGREENESGITPEKLAAAIPGAVCLRRGEDFSEIADYILKNTDENDVIFVMGAGDVIRLSALLVDH